MTQDWHEQNVQPPPVPLRALPLEYVHVQSARRPGLVTAIGVMSIIVASLSLIMNLSTSLQSVGMMFVSRIPSTGPGTVTTTAGPGGVFVATGTVTVAPATGSGGAPAHSGDGTNPIRGWPPAPRAAAVQALREIRPLNEAQRARLDALLAECGGDVFPFDASAATPAQVKANVSEHGVRRSGTTNAGADYFVTGAGRIEVSSELAAFVPADRSRDEVRVTSQGVVLASGNTTVATTTTMPVFGNPLAGMSIAPFVLMMIASLANLGLAIYLLVIGIMVLRHSPRGARLHWAYVWIKLPLAVVGAVAYGWMMAEMMRGMSRNFAAAGAGPVFPTQTLFFIFYGVFMLLISWAYPIGLIFTLRSRGVRAYYGSIAEARRAPETSDFKSEM